MKERLSELMDGELDDRSAAALLDALGRDRQALQAWRTYHVISDAMRETLILSEDFAARFSERLAAEATVLAPRARPMTESRKWFALSAAASLAAVAFVGWMAFAPQPGVAPAAQVQPAQVPAQVAQVAAQVADVKPNIVPLPTAANDYLLAHQGFSPRVSLQGMAPYVRTVSEQAVEPRR
jgi:sigma-E factor negative regulatory protein RseA